jgi:hypothetical protein
VAPFFKLKGGMIKLPKIDPEQVVNEIGEFILKPS